MNKMETESNFGTLIEPATLKIERKLPGPVERVWSYLTEGELRRKWLASGAMELKVGAEFELTWRNDELTTPPGKKPEGFPCEHSMQSRILEVDPPNKLIFTWGEAEVSFDLKASGDDTLLTVIHRRLPDRRIALMVSSGWHMHLEILIARLAGETPEPFWDGWVRLKSEYDRRLPAEI